MTKTISVDLGGTHLRFAVVDNGEISNYSKLDTPKTKKEILEQIINGIENRRESGISKVGVACAGIIENGKVVHSPNLPIDGTDLKKHIEKKCRLKTEIENDTNCSAMAEAKYGSKRKNFIFVTLGTGIGGGIIIDGKLYKGKGSGGEIGHIILNRKERFEYLFQNSKKKNDTEKVADYVGQGIASLTAIFDPEIVVLAGGMKALGNPFLKKIKSKTKKYLFMHKMPEIKWTSIKHPELTGASLLFEN